MKRLYTLAMKHKLSIISVNYNQTSATCALLHSTRKWKNCEWIVVDNASDEDPTPIIKKRFPKVKVIRSQQNLGFAGGNNLGIIEAEGDYILFLNNDTIATPNLAERMMRAMEQDEEIGMVSPKILYKNEKKKIQYAGYTPIHVLTGRNATIGEGEEDQGQYNEGRETPYIHGAAFMMHRKVLDMIGRLPADYFLYYEELDYSMRARNAGFKLWYEGSATVYHHASLSVGLDSPLKTHYYHRNRILFQQRHTHPVFFSLFVLYYMLVVLPKSYWQFRSKPAHRKALNRALLWHLKPKSSGKKSVYSTYVPGTT